MKIQLVKAPDFDVNYFGDVPQDVLHEIIGVEFPAKMTDEGNYSVLSLDFITSLAYSNKRKAVNFFKPYVQSRGWTQPGMTALDFEERDIVVLGVYNLNRSSYWDWRVKIHQSHRIPIGIFLL